MLEKVKTLLKQGEIKEALRLLVAEHPDAIVLLNQFLEGERMYGLVMLDYNSWEGIKKRTTQKALKIVAELESQTMPDLQAQNGRLLEALRRCVSEWDEYFFHAQRQVAAYNNSPGVGHLFDYMTLPTEPEWVSPARDAIAEAEQLSKEKT